MEEPQVHTEPKERAGFGVDGAAEPLGKTIMDFFAVLARWRRFITRFVLAATVITTVVTLLLPKWYKSTASVFPAEQTSIFPDLGGVSSLFKSLSGGASKGLSRLTGNSEADRYTAILKSGRVLSAMIDKFNLVDYYDYSSSSYRNEKTSKELIDNTSIELQDEGNLTVSVFDKDPKRAADMANYYVDLLNQTNSELMVQNAKGNREFIEQRYQKNLTDLRVAEDAMQNFQTKFGVIAVPEQTEATIKAGAELYGKLAVKEIDLDILKRTASESHPSVAQAEVEVEEIRKKLREMNAGSFTAGDDMKILVPFKQAPQLAAQYLRLYRDLQIQNKILEFITPLYEQAKVEENRNTPSVVVLDRAGVPERKAKPKVSLYALLAFVISTMLSLFVVFTAEGIERLRFMYPERFGALVGVVRSDWFGLRLNGFSRKSRKQE
jgi:capsule polysaccharide export protein KpsE/RkpR